MFKKTNIFKERNEGKDNIIKSNIKNCTSKRTSYDN